jgi:hypothetical protein
MPNSNASALMTMRMRTCAGALALTSWNAV